MPVITQCPQCGKKLRAADDRVNKQVKCPHCKNPFTIVPVATDASNGGNRAPPPPRSKRQAPAQPKPVARPATTDWYVQSPEGTEYGPIGKEELDVWVSEDRLGRDCQVFQEGWTEWRWAEDVYPHLSDGGQEVEANPFDGIGDKSPPATTDNRFAPFGGVEENPYVSPSTSSVTAASDTSSVVTPAIKRAMAQTRVWVMFLSILGFIGAAFMVVVALMMMVAGGMIGLIPGFIYLAGAGISGYGSFLMLNFASRISNFNRTASVSSLQAAIIAQKSFWKYSGIVTACYIGFVIVMFVAGIALGAAGALSAIGK